MIPNCPHCGKPFTRCTTTFTATVTQSWSLHEEPSESILKSEEVDDVIGDTHVWCWNCQKEVREPEVFEFVIARI